MSADIATAAKVSDSLKVIVIITCNRLKALGNDTAEVADLRSLTLTACNNSPLRVFSEIKPIFMKYKAAIDAKNEEYLIAEAKKTAGRGEYAKVVTLLANCLPKFTAQEKQTIWEQLAIIVGGIA